MNGDFRDLVMFLVVILGGLGIPMGLYLAYRAAMATIRGMDAEAKAKEGLPGGHLAELEQRVAELEERLDFTERVLADKTVGRLDG
jgi:hypothetical protein